MKKKLFLLGITLPSLILIPSCYYLEKKYDTIYIPGSLTRGLRCLYTAVKITNKYLYNGINTSSHEYAATNLRDCFTKNGGCYVKLGQFISQLEHIIPEPYTEKLEPLMQANKKSEFQQVKKLLEMEYGKKMEELFLEFDPEPLGVASLAQVHKAKLKDGTPVAVKVQHSYVLSQSIGDIYLVKLACYMSEKIFKDFKYRWLGKEFEDNLPLELNFLNEARNAERIKELHKHDKRVIIPKIYWDYCKPRVLVMSFEEGSSITDMDYLRKNKIDVKEVSLILCEIFYKQIFQFGFVHSDPHPGNIYIRKEKENGKEVTKIVLLDHGLYRDYDDHFRYNYCNLWRAIYTQNKSLLEKSCLELGVTNSPLFVSVLLSKTYDSVFNDEEKYHTGKRFSDKSNMNNKKESAEEKAKIRKLAATYHKDITVILNNVRREMLLLLKINEFVRAIDRKIGNPINNIELMLRYFTEELIKFEREKKNYKEILKIRFENFCFMYIFFFYRFISFFISLFSSVKNPIEEDNFRLD